MPTVGTSPPTRSFGGSGVSPCGTSVGTKIEKRVWARTSASVRGVGTGTGAWLPATGVSDVAIWSSSARVRVKLSTLIAVPYRMGDNALAEDLTAATFEKALRGRATYRHDRAAFTTWLFTIARHEAANYFRRPRGREVPLEYARQCDDARSVEDEVARRDDLARLVALLGQLPARERELIELKYGAALTNRAIAQLTGLSESNVGTLLGRVVRHLAKVWEETP